MSSFEFLTQVRGKSAFLFYFRVSCGLLLLCITPFYPALSPLNCPALFSISGAVPSSSLLPKGKFVASSPVSEGSRGGTWDSERQHCGNASCDPRPGWQEPRAQALGCSARRALFCWAQGAMLRCLWGRCESLCQAQPPSCRPGTHRAGGSALRDRPVPQAARSWSRAGRGRARGAPG